jgi:IS1 family transposase
VPRRELDALGLGWRGHRARIFSRSTRVLPFQPANARFVTDDDLSALEKHAIYARRVPKPGVFVENKRPGLFGRLCRAWHWDKRGGGDGTGGIGSGKTPIVGAVSRKGNVVARVVANVQAATLNAFVRETVSHKVSLLCTDQWAGYRVLDKDFPHATVDHARGQYVVGAIHTQTIEGFWSIFKRGVVGTFHKMSRKYLPLYVAEFQFRYNNRENADIFGTAIKGC